MINMFDVIIDSDEAYKVAKAWERFGGSFLRGMVQALYHADVNNIHKIKTTWPEEWEDGLKKYESIKEE